MSWLNQRDYGHHNGYSGRRNRTPRIVMFLRCCVPGFLICGLWTYMIMPPQGKVGWSYTDGVCTLEDQIDMVIGVGIIAPLIGSFLTLTIPWFFFHLVSTVEMKNDAGWQQFLEEGGSPFWDHYLPWPFNPDSKIVRWGGCDYVDYDENGVPIHYDDYDDYDEGYDEDYNDPDWSGDPHQPTMPMERRES